MKKKKIERFVVLLRIELNVENRNERTEVNVENRNHHITMNIIQINIFELMIAYQKFLTI